MSCESQGLIVRMRSSPSGLPQWIGLEAQGRSPKDLPFNPCNRAQACKGIDGNLGSAVFYGVVKKTYIFPFNKFIVMSTDYP